ncbi:MAG: AbrB family transcriptional regulator [Synergistaceae bacterium]|nr:AbrB family transcriptional regulator [Synergistaceae bacterium]
METVGASWLGGFCFTFGVGSLGYFVFRFFRVPSPALLGSMIATGALNMAGFYPLFDTRGVSFVANMMVGIMLGRQIDRNVLRRFRTLARPVLTQVAGMLALSLFCGVTMYLMGGTSFSTALISGAAGGIAEMVVFGMSINADAAVIAFVQLFRVVIFLALIPYLAIIGGKLGGLSKKPRLARERSPQSGENEKTLHVPFSPKDYWLLPAWALGGAVIGTWLKVPTGAMLGAMVACGVFSLCLGKEYRYGGWFRCVAQIGLGLAIGQRMTPHIAGQLETLFFPAIVVTGVMLVGCTSLAFFLYKTSEWDLTTCLLCSAPAGLNQIGAFAEEIGVDSFTASIFHTARIVGIVTLYPWLVLPLT